MSKIISFRIDADTLDQLRNFARERGVKEAAAARYLVLVGLGQDHDAAAFVEGASAGLAAFRRNLQKAAKDIE
ncbi:hypothetical protein LCGC14_1281370 [marine sediment metagenome]|uniref:Uncharacterized protein n=1 Tax=marine sediment metagenome TaxID=412755 RepID=A0A0F9LG57_9ZZZZ